MKTLRWMALGISITALTSGCGGKVESRNWEPAQVEPAQPVQESKQAPARPGDRMDANAGSADVLAQKTENYTRELAALMQARRSTPQLPAVASQVQWLDQPFPTGAELRLGGEPSPARPAAAIQDPIRPVIDTGPVAANEDDQRSQLPPLAPTEQPRASLRVEPITVAEATPRVALPNSLGPDALSIRIESRLKDSPRDVWAHTEYQLLRLLRDESTPEMSSLASLPQEDREVVTALVDGLTNFRNGLRRDSNMLLSAKIRPIVETADRLLTQAELTIPAIALCTKVDRFGVYDPIEPARFAADRDHPVIVYCEVANFMSSLNPAKIWATQLQWDMTLYTEQAIPVWSDQTQVIDDTSRTRRSDFFVRKLITIPRTLPIGRYLLKVTIVDKQSNHVAEATAPIVIAAQ